MGSLIFASAIAAGAAGPAVAATTAGAITGVLGVVSTVGTIISTVATVARVFGAVGERASEGQAATNISVNTCWGCVIDGEWRNESKLFEVNVLAQGEDFCNRDLTKGMPVYVEGSLTNQTGQTQDGEGQFSLDVTLTKIQCLSCLLDLFVARARMVRMYGRPDLTSLKVVDVWNS